MVTLGLDCAPSGTVMKTKQNSLQIEIGINVGCHFLIPLSMYDFLDIAIDEIIEGINMLLYQPPHLFPRQTNKQNHPLSQLSPGNPHCFQNRVQPQLRTNPPIGLTISKHKTLLRQEIPMQGRIRHLKKGR